MKKRIIASVLCLMMVLTSLVVPQSDIMVKAETVESEQHTWSEYTVTVPPTCMKPGMESAYCLDPSCTAVDTREIDPLGHSFTAYVSDGNANCEENGTETAMCSREGCESTNTRTEEGSRLPHTPNWELVKPATFTEDGTMEYLCEECRENVDGEGITIGAAGEVVLSSDTFIYNGQVCRPEVSVQDADGNWLSTEWYDVTYSDENSTAVGTYTVTVTLKGNYSGSETVSYIIKKPDLISMERNGSFADAVTMEPIDLDQWYSSKLFSNNIYLSSLNHYVKVDVSEAGYLTVVLKDEDPINVGTTLYDLDRNEILDLSGKDMSLTRYDDIFPVDKGQYILKINTGYKSTGSLYANWQIAFTKAPATVSLNEAVPKTMSGSSYTGFGVLGKDTWVKIKVTSGGKFTFRLNSEYSYCCDLYNAKKKRIKEQLFWGKQSGYNSNMHFKGEIDTVSGSVILGEGTYYLKLTGCGEFKITVNGGTASSLKGSKVTLTKPTLYAQTYHYKLSSGKERGITEVFCKKNSVAIKMVNTKTADAYEIWRATSKTGKYTKIKTVTNKPMSTASDKGMGDWHFINDKSVSIYCYQDSYKISQDKCYYYKIRLKKTENGHTYYSAFTAPQAYWTTVNPMVKITSNTTSGIKWAKSKGADGYMVREKYTFFRGYNIFGQRLYGHSDRLYKVTRNSFTRSSIAKGLGVKTGVNVRAFAKHGGYYYMAGLEPITKNQMKTYLMNLQDSTSYIVMFYSSKKASPVKYKEQDLR